MKGIQGLFLAIVLGIAGAALNWLYLTTKSGQFETVAFVGISRDAEIDQGTVLRESDLVAVEVPRGWVGNLGDFAIPYTALQTVVGQRISRAKPEGEGSLLLEQDLQTPRQELKFGDRERVIWIPVDTRTFVPTLVEPGDLVSFLVSRAGARYPTPAESGDPEDDPSPPQPTGPTGPIDAIGPFKILSLGNRLGSAQVLRASRTPQVQENVMAIAVQVDENGNLAADAQKLMAVLQETNFSPVGIMLHPRGAEAD